jgi:hypothetical protein
MFSLRSLLILLSGLSFALIACEKAPQKADVKTPAVYHIRLELGNYWAGREDEIYFDYDSSMAKQHIHYFKYNDADSIIFNTSYEVEKTMMDSVFLYAVAALRNEKLFFVDKYEPKDVNTMRLEVIANERMLACSYNNVLKPSVVSPEFAKLVKMINKCVGDTSFVK